MRTLMILAAAAAVGAGCRSWKTEPDLYRIDCNVPYAKVFVYDRDGKLQSTQSAGEFFPELDEKGHVEVKAEGVASVNWNGCYSRLVQRSASMNCKATWYLPWRLVLK